MKKHVFLFASIAALLCSSCTPKIEDEINDYYQEINSTKVDFSYSVSDLTVTLTAESMQRFQDLCGSSMMREL